MTGKHILIAEDEKPMAHAMELKLKHEGFDVTVAYNGEEALEAISKVSFDMILLDLVMPRVDGFEVLQKLKDDGKKIPTLVLSNLSQTEDETKVKDLGALDLIIKSNVPIADIVTRVEKELA